MVSTRFLSTSFLVLALGGVLPQLVNADCPNCGAQVTCREKCGWFSGCCRDKCCYQKIVIKHASVAPAPYGYAVASAPVAMVHVPTFSLAAAPVAPYAPAVPAAPAAPQFTAEEVQAFRQWYESQRRAAPVAPAAPSAPTAAAQKCDDPCGQILQLRQDVDQMKVALDKISIAVLKLAEAKNP
ncbi:MAG: hypothetical protein JSS02_30835 [Planctomycetes bacterium]|nr:hypothetical protein [Planctomycetota bacterium]